MFVRRFSSIDLQAIIELFRGTVLALNAADYSADQIEAWATMDPDLEKWGLSLAGNYSLVALAEGEIVGFGDMSPAGYLDRLFTHKDYQRQGVGTLIVNALEDYAFNSLGLGRIHTQASITARSFFLQRGYCLKGENKVERRGQILVNYTMEKLR